MNSLWIDSVKGTSKFESLDKNLEADICIIGAGIFGMTCGYYLSHLGFKVVLIDKNNWQVQLVLQLVKSLANTVYFILI